jgi:zinc D-Ala-D-Ala carboxypeptidase
MSFLFWLLGLVWLKAVPETKAEQSIPVSEIYACIESGSVSTPQHHTWATVKDSAYDIVSDDSLRKYVGPDVGLNDITYVPQDLVSIDNIPNIEVRSNEGKLRKEAAEALSDLAQAFHKEFGKPLVIVSSYRGYAYQKSLLAWYIAKMWTGRAQWLSAKPWHSEHQLWLAIDVFNTSTDTEDGYKSYFSRLRAHAHAYGWTQSYQKWQSTDGYVREPRHWRYVGVNLASYLWKHKMTFSEYLRN